MHPATIILKKSNVNGSLYGIIFNLASISSILFCSNNRYIGNISVVSVTIAWHMPDFSTSNPTMNSLTDTVLNVHPFLVALPGIEPGSDA
jgi:hypothetical protein